MKNSFLTVTLILSIHSVIVKGTECGINGESRIVGGYEADNGRWPWMVSLRAKGYPGHICGGVLIHQRYVLTAGHCTYLFLPTQYEVHIGLHYSNDNNHFISPVKKIYRHPNYTSTVDRSQNVFDFAVLELANDTNKIFPVICLPSLTDDLDYDRNKNTTVLGWGLTNVDATELAQSLQETTLVLLNGSSPVCIETAQGPLIVNSSLQLCAGRLEGGIGTCGGDSGGPLMAHNSRDNRWYLIGITSYAWSCALPASPTIFLRVSAYISWMQENIPDLFLVESSITSVPPATVITTKTIANQSSSLASLNVTSAANTIRVAYAWQISQPLLNSFPLFLSLCWLTILFMCIYE